MDQHSLLLSIRKVVTFTEETRMIIGRDLEKPTRKAIAAAVILNPWAGKYVDDLTPMYELGARISVLLAERAVAALGVPADVITSYGKGAVVGTNGELEHTAALLHPQFGGPVRALIGGGKAIIPGTKKVGGPGAPLVMPLTNRDDIWSFDEMDAAEIAIPDAPGADEILVALCFGVGGRPGHRVGL